MATEHKLGTVAIIGAPNAGKSSLLNALIGCQVAIAAPIAGTTREAIRGILNTPTAQIIFIDTPGMQTATNLLERQMMRAVSVAVKTADVILFVIDITHVTDKILEILKAYETFGLPVVLALTKIDTAQPNKILMTLNKLKNYSFVKDFVPVSAHLKIGLDDLVKCLEKYLPFGEAVYADEIYTDMSLRDMSAELIRGAIINHVGKEIPAGVKVVLTNFQQDAHTTQIDADIICDKPNHKKIIIGKNGNMIREIGIAARKDLEKLIGRHVDLRTFVIVRTGWRDNTSFLN